VKIYLQFKIEQNKMETKTKETISTADLIKAFTYSMTHEDIDGIVNLFAVDGEWVIMATGEKFSGLEQIRQLATRSVAARDHKSGEGLLPSNVFTNVEGTKFIWEYKHIGVVTEKWPASTHKPGVGTKFELPIILMCEVKEGKLIELREYFDLQTLTEAGTPHHLYS
jgi:ketosteroid isomerase-like protein